MLDLEVERRTLFRRKVERVGLRHALRRLQTPELSLERLRLDEREVRAREAERLQDGLSELHLLSHRADVCLRLSGRHHYHLACAIAQGREQEIQPYRRNVK